MEDASGATSLVKENTPKEGQTAHLFKTTVKRVNELDVTFAQFKGRRLMTWSELFEGFQTLRAITYSSSAAFIRDLFDLVPSIEVIFGSPVSVRGDIARLMAAQQAGVEVVRDELGRVGASLLELLRGERLRIFYARYPVHRKTFLLEKPRFRRVITGSANLSSAAFGGLQSEHLIVFDNDPEMFQEASSFYDRLLGESDTVPAQLFEKVGSVEVSDLPTFQKILKTQQAFVVEPDRIGVLDKSSGGEQQNIFIIKTEEHRRHFIHSLPHTNGHAVAVLPGHIRKAEEQCRQNLAIKGIERKEVPRFEIDLERREVRYKGALLDLQPTDEQVRGDAALLDEFMRGYRGFFSGRVDELVRDYATFMTWLFAAPFLCHARECAVRNDYNVFRYPACGVLYGKSNAGKTDLIRVLMHAMFRQEWWLRPKDFNVSTFEVLAERAGSFPIVVDDISRDRFREHAMTIIKDDFRNGVYPALVLSANETVKAVEPEILKRSIVIHADASMPAAMNAKNNLVTRVRKNIGNALYRRYLGRMVDNWAGFVSEFQNARRGQAEVASIADLLMQSSSTLRELMGSALGSIPDWCAPVDLDSCVAMNGRKVKDRMRSQWEYKRDSFRVDRRGNRLIMTVADQLDLNEYRKDIPPFVLDCVRQDKVVMLLDKAGQFFGIPFARSKWRGIFGRSSA